MRFIQITLALRPRRQRGRQKRTGLISKKKNNSAHAAHFFYIFCRHYTTKTSEKFPHGMFYRGQKNTPRRYFLSPSKFGLGPEVKSWEFLQASFKLGWNNRGKLRKKRKKNNNNSDVFTAVAVFAAKAPCRFKSNVEVRMVSKIRLSAGLQKFRSKVSFPGPDQHAKSN